MLQLPRIMGPPGRQPTTGCGLDLAEITRIYGIRDWTVHSYKQVLDQLGWADFQVRSDVAIRRHQVLVNCAFSFCWAVWSAKHPPQHGDTTSQPGPGVGEGGPARSTGAARDTRLAFPWIALQRWWPAWSTAPPPQALMTSRKRATACTSTS